VSPHNTKLIYPDRFFEQEGVKVKCLPAIMWPGQSSEWPGKAINWNWISKKN
jgi:hypothetical protein